MNRRLYGAFSLPIALGSQPYTAEPIRLGGSKKTPVRGRSVSCQKCGVSRTTLRKHGDGYLCPKCWEGRK